jgi:hypothetical protein
MIRQKGSAKSFAFSWSFFPRRKKGVIEPGMKFLIGLVLTLTFFSFAYVLLFTDFGPRIIDAANYYVFSPIGIYISPKSLAMSPAGLLDAKITAVPEGTVCSFEPVYFSAKDTTLPKGQTLDKMSCFWDFDLSSEPCDDYSDANPPPPGLNCAPGAIANNSDKEDDYESTNCYIANSSGPWPLASGFAMGEKGVKLVANLADKSDEAVTIINGSLFCACATSKPCSPNVELNPPLRAEISNGQTVNISFNSLWEFSDIHLILEPASGQPRDLYIIAGAFDDIKDYSFGGNLTSPTVVYGMNLARAVEKHRAVCKQYPCPVPFVFKFQGGGSIRIKEVWIPLSSPV